MTHHGCLRLDGLLDADRAAYFTDVIDRAFEACDQRNQDPASRSPWFVPFEVGEEKAAGFGSHAFVRTADVPTAMRHLVDVFTRSGLRAAVAEYFGERPAMIANKWVLRLSPSGKIGTDYHQDGAFLGEGIRTLNCWIALSDCGPGTNRPAMELVPRRFDLLGPDPDAAFGWSVTEETVAASMPGAPVVSPVFRAGDALLFDERLPHRTSVGLDLSPRYAIESWFVAPSSYPAKHVPFVL
ncbi:MAG: phytanoyl-CoA dioxygenase family protein [Acidimicrobiales bacterium]